MAVLSGPWGFSVAQPAKPPKPSVEKKEAGLASGLYGLAYQITA